MNGSPYFANPNLFIVSGGPGAGKTTTLRALAKLGYDFVPEVARQLIQEQVERGGQALPWADREAYAGLMLVRSIESFRALAPSSTVLFTDRGIPVRWAAPSDRTARYGPVRECLPSLPICTIVFLAPPFGSNLRDRCRAEAEFRRSRAPFHRIAEVYAECGYETIILPKATAFARARFILEQVRTRAGTIGIVVPRLTANQ